MDNEICVRLETTMGNITVKLYNETPKHRDNFIKLVKEQAYDNTSFHRVIKNFMIQGGDIQNKKLNYPTDYTIPAEFNPALFHKKEGLQPRLHSRFSAIPLKTNFIIYPEKPVNSESHLHRWSDSVSAYIRSDMH